MPHGGFRNSGYGTDLSMYGFEDYTRVKHVVSSFEAQLTQEPPRKPGSASGALVSCTITPMNPLSGVFGEAWRMYRAHAGHLIGIAFVIYVVAAIADGLVSLAGSFLVTILGLIITVLAGYLVQAALVKSVQDIRDGRADLSIGETVAAGTAVLLPVTGAALLAGIAIGIGLILIIVPGLFLITIWAVIIPVIVIERAGALSSFGRSYQLVRGHGWHVLGTLVVAWVIQFVVSIVLGVALFALPLFLRNAVSTVVTGALVAPFIALIVTLIYFRLLAAPTMPQDPAYPQGPYGQGGFPPQDGYPQGNYPPPPPGNYPPPPPPPEGNYPPPGNSPPSGGAPQQSYPTQRFPPQDYPEPPPPRS